MARLVAAAVLIAQLSAVINRKAALDKTLEQRRSEANQTKSKHAEFPSIPEAQAKYRFRDEHLRDILKDDEQKLREKLVEVLAKLPSNLPGTGGTPGEAQLRSKESQQQALQAIQKDIDGKLAAFNTAWKTHQDVSKGTVDSLKTQLEELKTQLDQYKTQLAEQKIQAEQDLTKQRDAFKEEIQSMYQRFEAATAEQTSTIRAQQQEQIRLNEQGMEILGQIKKQQQESTAQHKSQQEESTAQFKSQQEASAALFKKQQDTAAAQLKKQQEASSAQLRKQQDSTRSSESASAKDLAIIRKENTELKSENDSLRSIVSQFTQRVEELEEREAEREKRATDREKDLETLAGSVATCTEMMKEQGLKVEQNKKTLMNIDFEALDEISESYSLEFPKVQQDLKKVQDGIMRIDKYLDDEVLNTVGGWVDGLRKQDVARAKEVQDLRDQVKTFNKSAPASHLPVEDSSIKLDVEALKTEYDGFSAQTQQSIEEIRKQLQDETKCLAHQYSVLDQKYNSITTKDLAERILGLMENLYPEPKTILAKLGLIHSMVEEYKKKLDEAEEEATAIKRRLEEVASICQRTGHPFRELGERSARHFDDFPRKRARKEAFPNGTARSASHNVVYVNGVNGPDEHVEVT